MSIREELIKSIETKDLASFVEITTKPGIHVNDIVKNGVLHHLLEHNKDIPIDFIKALIDNPNVNLNKIHSETGLPPLLSTERVDIQDLLLANPMCNVNLALYDKMLLSWVVEKGDLVLLKKLIDHPEIDLLSKDETDEKNIAVLQSMKNIETFKLFLESPKMDVDSVGWSGMLTPIQYSITNKLTEASLLLLQKGAKIYLPLDAHIGMTVAEYMLCKGSIELIQYVLDNIDRVDTTRFIQLVTKEVQTNLEYGVLESQMDLIRTLARKKCLINENVIMEGTVDVLNKILDVIDEPEINIKNMVLLVERIFSTGSRELVQKLVNSEYALRHKKHLLERFVYTKSGTVIETVCKREELVLDSVKDIFVANEYNIFVMLLKMGGVLGLPIINNLLEKSNVQLPESFPPLSLLIKAGSDHLQTIAVNLIEKHNVGLQTEEDMAYIIKNKKVSLLKAVLRSEHVKNNIHRLVRVNNFPAIVKLLGDDKEVRTKFIRELGYTHNGTKTIIRGLIDCKVDTVIDIISEESFDLNLLFLDDVTLEEPDDDIAGVHTFIAKLFTGSKDVGEKDKIYHFLEEKDLIDRFVDLLDLVTYYTTEDPDKEMLEYLLGRPKIVKSFHISELLSINPMFVFRNIDTYLRFTPEQLRLDDVMDAVIDQSRDIEYGTYDTIVDNAVFEKIIGYAGFDPNKLETTNEYSQGSISISQLQIVSVWMSKENEQQCIDHLMKVFQLLLEHDDIDVNKLNGPLGDETTVSALDLAAGFLDVNDEFEDKVYDTTEPKQMMVQLLLLHPKLNIMNCSHFHVQVCEQENKGYLFTIMLSRPEFDIDEAYLLHLLCSFGRDVLLNIVLTTEKFDINLLAGPEEDTTPLHACIESDKPECAKILIEDPRIDLSILRDGKTYAQLAVEQNMVDVIRLLAEKGIVDDRYVRMEREAAEYDARMEALGRRKQARLKSVIDVFDAILKERENPDALDGVNITLFSKSMCPFCLAPLEKEDPRECVYLSGHRCAPEVRNETLMQKYLGDNWATVHFEICCTCGRPGKNHGHYKIIPDADGKHSLAAPGPLVSHWACNEHNGGGGKQEMVTRLVGILTYLKRRVDSEEHLEDNAELSRQMATEADNALLDQSMIDRATTILSQQAWNANSDIPPYKRFNAPRAENAAVARVAEEREPIVPFNNRELGEDDKESCLICLEERDDLYRPHAGDTSYICGVCLYRTVCQSVHNSVTCELGCKPKKQIHKGDVRGLMDGQLCELMAPIAAEEDAQAARNENARRAGRNHQDDDLEDGEIRE